MVSSSKANRTSTPRKAPAVSQFNKKPAKNASILSFFQKTQKPEDSLFVGAISSPAVPATAAEAAPAEAAPAEDLYDCDDHNRYNESQSPNKRRKTTPDPHTLSNGAEQPVQGLDASEVAAESENEPQPKRVKPKIKTPFIMDSDSEEDNDDCKKYAEEFSPAPSLHKMVVAVPTSPGKAHISNLGLNKEQSSETLETSDIKDEVPAYQKFEELEQFEELDGFDMDSFEGEEMRERRFMQEQARLEAEEAGIPPNEDPHDDLLHEQSMIENCPICNGSLVGVSADDATRHVNACLDGNPIPLPKQENGLQGKKIASADIPVVESVEISKRFAKAAIPRPGQANPFEVDTSTKNTTTSAFSKLMSGKAEDSAWATAAAAENSSRGRPSYERTCPFYKIMPGFSICVDAFRYGAVQGCNAYFLSHFHSDHYIGLTASWRHGPIYCSKATGNLVKQQLRTAAKWVVELEFEKSYDIPGTDGASVIMIPANHCPGSSLFVFQKPAGKGPNSKVRRILHCGDFRACPEHLRHPILKPDILDSISGKLKQQKIDICYLDTTYLNPRYSFPPQGDVIRACAELCASMSPDPNCTDDIWEKSSKATSTPAVSKYFQSDKKAAEPVTVNGKRKSKQRLLVICGTYSIGKERICVAIAKALGSKIFATPAKRKICAQLDDPELDSLMTSNATEAQVHMQSLMEIRAETLQEYLDGYKSHFSRIVGFRPSGWNYRPPSGKSIGANTSPGSIPTQQILHGQGWKTSFGYTDLTPQRGSTKEAMCFGVPYSEHSSFRELAMFVMGLRIEKVIPTVNVGSEQSRTRMKAWIDRWMTERRRGGLVQPLTEDAKPDTDVELWDGKSGKGGGAWW